MRKAMTIAPSAAAAAYKSISGLEGGGLAPASPVSGADDFAQILSSQLGAIVDQGRAAEAGAAGLITGKAEIVDVVTAVAETEVAMETLVTLRDKVISAYEEIMRMPM